MLNALKDLPTRIEISDLIESEGSGVILDFIQRHIEKSIKEKLKLLKDLNGINDDQYDLKLPTSTATLAVVDDLGHVPTIEPGRIGLLVRAFLRRRRWRPICSRGLIDLRQHLLRC